MPVGGRRPADARCEARVVVAQAALMRRPALIAGATKAGVELLLNRALNAQPGTTGQVPQRARPRDRGGASVVDGGGNRARGNGNRSSART
jgi:hypothetical protein